MAAIVFDLDGTLVNSSKCILDSISYSLDKLGIKNADFCQISATQQDLKTTFIKMLKQYDRIPSDQEVMDFIDHYRWYHQNHGEECIQTFEGVQDVLGELKKEFHLAVATTKHTAEATRVMEKLKLDVFFDHIQGTDPGMRYKPEPDILFSTLRVLKKSAEQSAYVGDSLHDMHAAQSGGMKRIGAAYGFAGPEPLHKHGPDWMLYDIRELLNIQSELKAKLQPISKSQVAT